MPKNTNDKNSLVIYRRILRFDELLASQTYPTLQDLIQDEDGGSRTTVFRTLEFMREQLHAPIIFDRTHGGYCYTEKTFRLPALWTTEQEQFALILMQGLSSKLKGTPLYESTEKILNYLHSNTLKNPNDWENSYTMDAHEETGLDWVKDHYVFLNGSNFSVEKNNWFVFEQCMRSKHQVEFDYYYEKNKQWIKVNFNPYQIINSNNRWYLWGYNIDLKENRLYLLDLLRNAKITPYKFCLPKDFDFRKHTAGVFGAYAGKKNYIFKAEFSDWTIPYIKRTVWGNNQKIENIDEKKIKLTFEGSELQPFLSMLLSYGSYAKPIEPLELVTLWKREIEAMKEL